MLNHILVPLDGSLLAECVLSHAVTLAQVFETRLTLLRVVERNQATGLKRAIDPLQWQIRKIEAGAYLDSLVARLNRVGLQAEKVILEGLPPERIVEFTRDHRIGMILISTHGQSGLSGWNVSSVVQKVILHAHVPMMIVRAHTRALPQTSRKCAISECWCPWMAHSEPSTSYRWPKGSLFPTIPNSSWYTW
ncbi:MAG: hypothetical protein AMJ93_11575 [Anaerolineae bacterium SM23_84]|nr:MAG: hypothetical protein AMJ93_11575 [Anaerolineae bacterium SM23_84]